MATLPFTLFVSTTPDRFLLNAFNQRSNKPIYAFYHFKPDPKRPNPPAPVSEDQSLIYDLYGSLEQTDSLVLTENDLLDFLVNVTRQTPPLDPYVTAQFCDPRASFLFLGFGFRHWYVRILLHALKAAGHESQSLACQKSDLAFDNVCRPNGRNHRGYLSYRIYKRYREARRCKARILFFATFARHMGWNHFRGLSGRGEPRVISNKQQEDYWYRRANTIRCSGIDDTNMFWVMFGSLLALGIFVIIYARDADRSDAARLVFGSIVPLIGTWVGTVLGFYFGRENFKAASTSITAASSSITPQGKLETTPVASLGKKIQTTAKFQLGASDTKEDLTLDKIESAFVVGSEVYERLPLLLASGAPYMVLHRSTLNEFLLQKIKTDKTTDSKNYTLAELLTSEPWLPERSFAVVSMEATAAQAKVEMDKIPTCSDIFVTENGTRHSTVSRWITDVNLLEAARSLTIE